MSDAAALTAAGHPPGASPAAPGLPAPQAAAKGLRARAPRAPAVLWIPAVATAAMVGVPLLYVFVRAADRGLSGYFGTILAASTLRLLPTTLALALGVMALALTIAVPLAWLVTRTDLPGRRVWAVLGAMPLVFPSYVAAFSLVAVLGPRGYLQRLLEPLGVQRLPDIAYGYSGALLALGLFTYPYIYLLTVGALRRLDPALEESSRSLGVGHWRTFVRVVLPALRAPVDGWLAAGGPLHAVGLRRRFFDALQYLHGVDLQRLSIAFRSQHRGGAGNRLGGGHARSHRIGDVAAAAYPPAAAASLPTAAPRQPRRLEMAGVGGGSGLTLVTLGIPVGVVAFWGVRAVVVGNPLATAWSATLNSLTVAALAALAAVTLSVFIAAWSVRYPSRVSLAVERLAYAGYALPGIVVALSLVFFAIRTVRPLYQTFLLLVVAYVIRFLPEAVAASRSALAAIAPNFEEAARSLGRRPLAVLATLTLPMVRPGLLAGGALVFLTSMKELPATLILRPIGFDTLATRVWSAASEGIYSEAAVPALFLVLASVLPVYLLIIRPALAERA